jgi:hypothetical protein
MYSSPRPQCVITPTRFDCVPDGHVHRGFETEQLGHLGLERVDAGIVAEHVVADGRCGHRCAHRGRRSRHRIAAEISRHLPTLSEWIDNPRRSRFALQLWEQDDVADRRRIGEQHDEPVDADALARGGGKPYSIARM